jgi:hypothetical protein
VIQAVEALGRHADDARRHAVDADDRADDRGVAAEVPLPELVAEDDQRFAAGELSFARREHAAEMRREPQSGEVVSADALVDEGGRPRVRGQAAAARVEREDLVEHVARLTVILQPGIRDPEAEPGVVAGQLTGEDHDAIGVRHGKRPRVPADQRIDARIGADAEGKRRHRGDREGGCAPNLAQRVSHVVGERPEQRHSCLSAIIGSTRIARRAGR